MLFCLAHFNAHARLHIFKFASGELAVIIVFRDAEINVAISSLVGIAFFDQVLDELNDERHGAAHLWVGRGRQDVQVFKIVGVILNVALRKFEWFFTKLVGAVDDLIVYIGVIHHMLDFVASIFEITADDIEHQRGHRMTHMRIVINRYTADIEFYEIWLEGLKIFFFASEGIVKTDHFSTTKDTKNTKVYFV